MAPGISMTSAKLFLSEIGPTLDQFSTSAALASWCGLCPGNNQSAGKRRSGRSPVHRHRLKEIMIEVAWAAVRKKGSCIIKKKSIDCGLVSGRRNLWWPWRIGYPR